MDNGDQVHYLIFSLYLDNLGSLDYLVYLDYLVLLGLNKVSMNGPGILVGPMQINKYLREVLAVSSIVS